MKIHLEDNDITSLLGHNLDNYQEHVEEEDVEYFHMWNYVQVRVMEYFHMWNYVQVRVMEYFHMWNYVQVMVREYFHMWNYVQVRVREYSHLYVQLSEVDYFQMWNHTQASFMVSIFKIHQFGQNRPISRCHMNFAENNTKKIVIG